MRTLTAAAASLALALPLALASAAPASAARPSDPGKGGRCIAAGLATLNSLGATSAAARGQVDYSDFDNGPGGAGLIRTDLPDDSFLPLRTVIALHRTSPGLFAWCDGV